MRVPISSPARIRSSTSAAAPGAIRTCSTPPFERRQRRVQLGLHAAGRDARRRSVAGSRRRSRSGGCACRASSTPSTSVRKISCSGAEAAGAGHRHLVGIDVVDVALRGRRPRRPPPADSRWPPAGRAAPGWIAVTRPTAPSAGSICSASTRQRVDAGEPHRQRSGAVQAGHQFVIHAAGEDLEHRVEGLRRGDAQAVRRSGSRCRARPDSGSSACRRRAPPRLRRRAPRAAAICAARRVARCRRHRAACRRA